MIHQHTLAAYDALKPRLGKREAEVLAILEMAPMGFTGAEIAERLGRHPYVVRPRITGLVKKGLAIDSGTSRLNQTGRLETVWRRWHGSEQLEFALYGPRQD